MIEQNKDNASMIYLKMTLLVRYYKYLNWPYFSLYREVYFITVLKINFLQLNLFVEKVISLSLNDITFFKRTLVLQIISVVQN